MPPPLLVRQFSQLNLSQFPEAMTTSSDEVSPKMVRRAINERVMSIQASEDVVRRAIEIYDLQVRKHPAEVVNDVEEILGLKEILRLKEVEWPWQSFRRDLIRRYLQRSIKRILKSYGCVLFSFYNIESLLIMSLQVHGVCFHRSEWKAHL